MIRCPVCGAKVHRSNWMGHVARDKIRYGNDIFLKTRSKNSEYYNNLRNNGDIIIKKVVQTIIKLKNIEKQQRLYFENDPKKLLKMD